MPMNDVDPASASDWIHALRNAVNTTSLSVGVATRLLERGEAERALEFLNEAQSSCDSARNLLERSVLRQDAK